MLHNNLFLDKSKIIKHNIQFWIRIRKRNMKDNIHVFLSILFPYASTRTNPMPTREIYMLNWVEEQIECIGKHFFFACFKITHEHRETEEGGDRMRN